MQKFKFLISDGLKKALKKKSFLVINIIIFGLTLLIFAMPKIIEAGAKSEVQKVVVAYDIESDENQKIQLYLTSAYKDTMIYSFEEEIKIYDDFDKFIEDSKEEKKDIAVYFYRDSSSGETVLSAKLAALSSKANYLQLKNFLASVNFFITGTTPTPVEVIDQDNLYQSKMENMVKGILVGMLVSIPLMMIIGNASSYIGTSIVQEKSSRGIETILASVTVKQHYFSKIVTAFLYTGIQSLLILVYGAIAILIFGSNQSQAIPSGAAGIGVGFSEVFQGIEGFGIIVFMVLFFLFAALFYIVVCSFFASISNRQEDFQVFQTPIMMTATIGLYIVLFGSQFSQGGKLLKVFTYIPPFSAFAAPAAFAMQAVAWWEVLIGLGILVGLSIALIWLILPLYEASILSQDTDKMINRIKNAYKRARLRKRGRNN